jgi:hypothetical protein
MLDIDLISEPHPLPCMYPKCGNLCGHIIEQIVVGLLLQQLLGMLLERWRTRDRTFMGAYLW